MANKCTYHAVCIMYVYRIMYISCMYHVHLVYVSCTSQVCIMYIIRQCHVYCTIVYAQAKYVQHLRVICC